MIVNGKDININYRKAEEIQKKMNPINELPENLKVEANKKELKELEDIDSLLYNADFGLQNNNTYFSKDGKINRKEYYRKYNQEHPERLNKWFTKGYINGNINDGTIYPNTDFLGRRILGYDEFGMPVTNGQFGNMIKNYEMIWYDDDWCEEPDWRIKEIKEGNK